MDLETKCPHCDQYTASNVDSCSKCGGLLFESKEGANPLILSLKKNWKLVTGLAVAVLILSVLFFRPDPTPPPEKQAQNLPTEKPKEPPRQKPKLPPEKPKPKQQKPDLSGQLGFYGQWDKDKDGYLQGTEIVAALTELNNVEVNVIDISGEPRVVKFRWEPPRMDMDLDQRLSREELTQAARRYNLFEEYDLNKDGLLSKAEIEKEPVADIAGNHRKQLLFEPLKKFDLNQDGKLALLEIPPYLLSGMWRGRGGGERPKRKNRNGNFGTLDLTEEQLAQIKALEQEREQEFRKIQKELGIIDVEQSMQIDRLLREKYQKKMEAILTSEQKRKRDELEDERQERQTRLEELRKQFENQRR